MIFNLIDTQNWSRQKSYNHFSKELPCTYSMTVNLDITKFLCVVNKSSLSFFPTLLYGMTTVVNEHNEFRIDLDQHGNLGFYSSSNPYYTIFHEKEESFTNVWTEYHPDLHVFLKNYKEDMLIYKDNPHKSKPLNNNNIFNVSCIPWVSFTGFNLNLQKGYNYFLPIFTIGKYYTEGEKTLLPFAIQVHHAVCDGFHTARFVNELQLWLDTFKLQTKDTI